MSKNVTLKDIARETGVHVSTVSRALDPNSRHAISEEVVKRITDTASRLGYRPNRLAMGLRTRRTMTVGVMIPDITNTLFPPMVRGIESVLEPLGYASIIVNTDDDATREKRLLDALLDHGIDGIIDAAATRTDPAIKGLVDRGVPVVTVNRKSDLRNVPAVVSDEAEGIRAMLEHLHGKGHRRIAHIAGPATLSTGIARREAFEHTAGQLGIELAGAGIVVAKRYHERDGRQATETMFDNGYAATAILCANDRLALGAMEAVAARGLTCPADVSITGFNDIPLLDHISPGLTTVRILKRDIGRAAAEILVKMLSEPEARAPSTTVLPVELVVRSSVAPPKHRLQSAAG